MATMVKSFAIQGIEGYLVEIEATTLEGMPMISIIGLGDQAVKEAGERIKSAMDVYDYTFPKKKVVFSLAPSDKKKRGSHFDLAMAIALLRQTGELNVAELGEYGFIGELSLSGRLRPSHGILPMVIAAAKSGIKKMILPKENVREARLVHGIEIYGFDNLQDVVLFLEGKKQADSLNENDTLLQMNKEEDELDFRDVKGQNDLVEAVVLAAAGGHNMLMIGEPGCGKTMIAQRIPTILPEMTKEECLEITKIYSISGLVDKGQSLVTRRPFRAPHHNASLNALIGGGMNAMPGEVSLAHNGVLFLDELGEFTRKKLDALRQPVEDKKVAISRVNGNHTFPANFMFIAAMNPCPCGYHPSQRCKCTDYEIVKYRSKISGPIMDRIDIQKEVKRIDYFDLELGKPAPSSKELREKIERARRMQQKRYENDEGVTSNAQMSVGQIKKYCVLDRESLNLLKETCEQYSYSARVIHKLLRLARTSADLRGDERIQLCDVKRVLSCRDLDKSNSQMMVVT